MGESELISHVGMDATIFLRFTRMCRNMFLVLTLVSCCVLTPVHLMYTLDSADSKWLDRMTPRNVWNEPLWAQVVVAWITTAVVAGFLWWNTRKVCNLRRWYFESEEYQHSLHARTLMVGDEEFWE